VKIVRLVTALSLLAAVSACFIQHKEPVGVAEAAAPGQWSGAWVAQPNRDGEEPGFFEVKDVDPAKGAFTVEEADADGNGMGEPMELLLRRVGDRLFLDVRDKADGPWMLFVVEKATPEEIVLAWKPAAKPFEDAIAKGTYQARLAKNADGDVEEIVFDNLDDKAAESLAADYRDLFVAERITLKRAVSAD
jgi:hypothetical protein